MTVLCSALILERCFEMHVLGEDWTISRKIQHQKKNF